MKKKYDVVRCKKVYKQQPFFDREYRKTRGHIFQSLSFHFFLIQSLWCLRSQNKSFLAASKQAVFFLRKQLNSMAVSYFVEERKKNIATLICTRKNYLLLLTEKKKNFPPTKRNPILIKHTAQCIYMDNFGGKKSDSLSIPVTKTIFNLDAILSQELFCIKVAMYFTLYVFVWGKKV